MKNKEISIDTFSVLSNAGWLLTILKLAGVTGIVNWHAILGYWLSLAAISVAMGILTALIGLWTKGGEK